MSDWTKSIIKLGKLAAKLKKSYDLFDELPENLAKGEPLTSLLSDNAIQTKTLIGEKIQELHEISNLGPSGYMGLGSTEVPEIPKNITNPSQLKLWIQYQNVEAITQMKNSLDDINNLEAKIASVKELAEENSFLASELSDSLFEAGAKSAWVSGISTAPPSGFLTASADAKEIGVAWMNLSSAADDALKPIIQEGDDLYREYSFAYSTYDTFTHYPVTAENQNSESQPADQPGVDLISPPWEFPHQSIDIRHSSPVTADDVLVVDPLLPVVESNSEASSSNVETELWNTPPGQPLPQSIEFPAEANSSSGAPLGNFDSQYNDSVFVGSVTGETPNLDEWWNVGQQTSAVQVDVDSELSNIKPLELLPQSIDSNISLPTWNYTSPSISSSWSTDPAKVQHDRSNGFFDSESTTVDYGHDTWSGWSTNVKNSWIQSYDNNGGGNLFVDVAAHTWDISSIAGINQSSESQSADPSGFDFISQPLPQSVDTSFSSRATNEESLPIVQDALEINSDFEAASTNVEQDLSNTPPWQSLPKSIESEASFSTWDSASTQTGSSWSGNSIDLWNDGSTGFLSGESSTIDYGHDTWSSSSANVDDSWDYGSDNDSGWGLPVDTAYSWDNSGTDLTAGLDNEWGSGSTDDLFAWNDTAVDNGTNWNTGTSDFSSYESGYGSPSWAGDLSSGGTVDSFTSGSWSEPVVDSWNDLGAGGTDFWL